MRRELRGRSLVNDPGERLTRVELAVRFLELPGRTLEVEVAGGQDASSHGCQMRHECQPQAPLFGAAKSRQLLDDFREVPVALDRVRADRLVDLAEMHSHARRASGATHPRLGVDDDVRADEPGRHGRSESQDRGGRVAARHGDHLRVFQVCFVQLGDAKNSLAEQRRCRVLPAIPLRILLRIVEPEVGAHVDHPDPGGQPALNLCRAYVMWKAAEDDVEAV